MTENITRCSGLSARDDDPLRKVRDSKASTILRTWSGLSPIVSKLRSRKKTRPTRTPTTSRRMEERTLFCAYHAHKMAEAFVDDLLATL